MVNVSDSRMTQFLHVHTTNLTRVHWSRVWKRGYQIAHALMLYGHQASLITTIFHVLDKPVRQNGTSSFHQSLMWLQDCTATTDVNFWNTWSMVNLSQTEPSSEKWNPGTQSNNWYSHLLLRQRLLQSRVYQHVQECPPRQINLYWHTCYSE